MRLKQGFEQKWCWIYLPWVNLYEMGIPFHYRVGYQGSLRPGLGHVGTSFCRNGWQVISLNKHGAQVGSACERNQLVDMLLRKQCYFTSEWFLSILMTPASPRSQAKHVTDFGAMSWRKRFFGVWCSHFIKAWIWVYVTIRFVLPGLVRS